MRKKKRWPCLPKYTKGDSIYYCHRNKDTYPGIVLQVKNQMIKIEYNSLQGDVITWVKEQNLYKQ